MFVMGYLYAFFIYTFGKIQFNRRREPKLGKRQSDTSSKKEHETESSLKQLERKGERVKRRGVCAGSP